MTIKVDVISGFLGAGKTTMIRKLLDSGALGDNITIIENEYGQIAIDSGRLAETGIEIRSMEAGCICCSLSGDFRKALLDLIGTRRPSRIIIEPTGVGRLSDILEVVSSLEGKEGLHLNMVMTLIDALDFEDFIEVFGDFYRDQIRHARVIVLSKTQLAEEAALQKVITRVRALNPEAALFALPWEELSAHELLQAGENGRDRKAELLAELTESAAHGGEEHEGRDGHSAEEHAHEGDKPDFEVWSFETMRPYKAKELEGLLLELKDPCYGRVLRSKGTVPAGKGTWLDFDLTPSLAAVTEGKAQPVGQMAVIGLDLDQTALTELFGLLPERN